MVEQVKNFAVHMNAVAEILSCKDTFLLGHLLHRLTCVALEMDHRSEHLQQRPLITLSVGLVRVGHLP